MTSCAIATCLNTYRNSKERNVIFHRFPQKDLLLSKEWVQKCRRKDTINPKNARICSEHFTSSDYIDDMQNRLLGRPVRRKLKENAIPSKNLSSLISEDQITPRSERQKKRKVLQDAEERLRNLSPMKICQNVEDRIQCKNCDDIQAELNNLQIQLATTKSMLSNLKNEKRSFKLISQKLKRAVISKNLLAVEVRKLKRKLNIMNKENMQMRNLKKCLNGIFSETQINAILERKKIKWTSEDVSKCIVLRALSSKAYEFWREKVGLPLPSASTLKRWCSKFSCNPGILDDVLRLMRTNCENLSQMEKLCALSFDEIHIDSKLCYDTKLDQILGPFKKVQFVLARGLFSTWKQPVYFQFDQAMHKSLLFSIIEGIESTGVQVKAIVSDLGGSLTLWKELKISAENSSFSMPSNPTSKIWVFADMPHYIKLLRNHFLDKGLALGDGTIITTDIIKEILEKDNAEIKLCHKLKPQLLAVKGNGRQKVSFAKTLFSATTAKAILHFTQNRRVSDFFLMVDNFFDLMNSKVPEPLSDKPLKAAFGKEKFYSDQKDLLNKVKKEISEMRVIGKKTMLPFQKGMLISINSLIGLHEELKCANIEYILTTRLTQDALESLFSQIRGLGRFNDHPSPSEVIIRLKRLLLANKLPNLSNKINHCDSNDNSNAYLTSEMLQNAFNSEELLSSEISQEEQEISSEDFLNVPNFEWESEAEDSLNSLSENEENALAFIAGFVAYRMRVKHNDPSLGILTKNLLDEPIYSSWIKLLSAGGLTVPTPEWMETIREMEKVFRLIHGDSFQKSPGVTKNLISKLEARFPEINKSAIRLFSRIRTFIRIRHLNRTASLVSFRKAQQKAIKWKKSSVSKLN